MKLMPKLSVPPDTSTYHYTLNPPVETAVPNAAEPTYEIKWDKETNTGTLFLYLNSKTAEGQSQMICAKIHAFGLGSAATTMSLSTLRTFSPTSDTCPFTDNQRISWTQTPN